MIGIAAFTALLATRNCVSQKQPRLCTTFVGGVEVQYLCGEAQGGILQKSTATPNPSPTPKFSCTDPGRDGTNAYEAAKAGGRHAGYYDQARRYADESLRSALQSYELQVANHIAKIAEPSSQQLETPWEEMSPHEQRRVLDKWCGDLIRNRELADIVLGLMRERGIHP